MNTRRMFGVLQLRLDRVRARERRMGFPVGSSAEAKRLLRALRWLNERRFYQQLAARAPHIVAAMGIWAEEKS